MTTGAGAPGASAFLQHLTRYPEDLRDIRRLGRRYRLSSLDLARVLKRLPTPDLKVVSRDEREPSSS
jgi:hypothetical protein